MLPDDNGSRKLGFISPTEAATGWAASAFVLGTFLGFTSLVGDSTGSYFKRRKGMKRKEMFPAKHLFSILFHLRYLYSYSDNYS